ncbi:MAG: acylphosphatase [Candidatus Limnocylindrales bacterium]
MEADSRLERLEATVIGRVQAVGFRVFVASRASALGLTGWVRNGSDGSVECVAEGRRADLETLLAVLQLGPAGARVESVSRSWSAASGAFDRFSIASGWTSGD